MGISGNSKGMMNIWEAFGHECHGTLGWMDGWMEKGAFVYIDTLSY
jgi:hypothetical protein